MFVYRNTATLPLTMPLEKMSLPPLSSTNRGQALTEKGRKSCPLLLLIPGWLWFCTDHVHITTAVENLTVQQPCWARESVFHTLPFFHSSDFYMLSATSSMISSEPWREGYRSPTYGWDSPIIYSHYSYLFVSLSSICLLQKEVSLTKDKNSVNLRT